MSHSWKEAYHQKLITPEKIEETVKDIRAKNQTIATLNGSFDLLHAGHLHMIYEASQQADILIVALNSDVSVKKYKSPYRPIITLDDRQQMMAALSFVDYVTSFEETDPKALLQKIKPDVHVNGSEYGQECLEADVVKENGGKIHIVKLVPGLSTTEMIKKIQSLCV